MNGIVEMADSDTGEDEMIDSLFYKCDTHGEGKVYVCTVIQFLKNCLGNGNVSSRFLFNFSVDR